MKGLMGASLAMLACALPAHAAEISNVRTIDMQVQGRIAEHCAMGAVPNMDFGDITRPGLSISSNVRFSCNLPFNMSIRARNGGLANARMPNGEGPYAGTLPYQIALAMPIRRPQGAMVTRNLESRQLQGNGANISSEGGIAVDGLSLNVSLGRPSGEAGLLAGQYGETIEITVTPE